MGVGAGIIAMVKTNTKGFKKDIIENLTKYYTGGSQLMIKSNPLVPVY